MQRSLSWMFAVAILSLLLAGAGLDVPAAAQVNVTTWQNDTLRTGQNLSETILTPENLSSSNFGQLCSAALDGQVYAQPLVLSNVTLNGTQYSSLVYVVTEMNTLYVINGTPPVQGNPCSIVATLSLNPPNQFPVDCNYLGAQDCGTIKPVLGALGTPVIQSVSHSNGTLYVLTETQDASTGLPKNWYHYLHAVNLDQIKELIPPVRVFPPGGVWHAAQLSYWSRNHIQRPGLLLVGNTLYVAFSMMDGNQPLFNGSVFAYNTTNLAATPMYFATTPDTTRNGGGIWQGGAGLAYGPDETGNNYIYFNTGNGSWDGSTNWSDSFVKLDPTTLTVPQQSKPAYFTPADQSYRACVNPYNDVDFGSGGVMLTPSTANWPFLAVSGDKEGGMWVMDRQNPGGFNLGQCSAGCNSCSQQLQNLSNQNIQTVWLTNGVHNNPAYWNNNVYMAPVNGAITQYPICNNLGSGQPFCQTAVRATGPNNVLITTVYGATPVISASGVSSNGILWVLSGNFSSESTRPGKLFAINATTMAGLYVNSGAGSSCSQVDSMAPVTKFSIPTVANGHVYIGTQALVNGVNNGAGTFYIFGLNRKCTTNSPRPTPRTLSTNGGAK